MIESNYANAKMVEKQKELDSFHDGLRMSNDSLQKYLNRLEAVVIRFCGDRAGEGSDQKEPEPSNKIDQLNLSLSKLNGKLNKLNDLIMELERI